MDNKQGFQLVNTVNKNLKYLSPQQIMRAKRARKLLHAMGTLTTQKLIAMIWMNLI
jgi:hypothetical protein